MTGGRGMLARVAIYLLALPVLSGLVFVLLHVVPEAPEGSEAEEARRARIEALRGLDRPLGARYRCWWVGRSASGCAWWPEGEGLLSGDWGVSSVHGRPVRELVAVRSGRTLGLMGPAFLLALGSAVGLGVAAARRPGGRVDRAVSALAFAGIASPIHWVALMAVWGLAVGLGWFPVGGLGPEGARGGHAVLPILVIASSLFGPWFRYVRAEVADGLGQAHVLGMRSRGLPEGRILGHVLRNAGPPLVTVIGHALPALLAGSVVVERVFVYPGMGLLFWESVVSRDLMVAGLLLLGFSAVTLAAALLTDLLAWGLDPRLRGEGAG